MRGRSNSAPPRLGQQLSVTLNVANNDPRRVINAIRTLTASNVRGFTQGSPTQRPTVYLQNGGVPSGRVTQEHPHTDNVGAHFQHGPEDFFGNVSSRTLREVKQEMPQNTPGPTRAMVAVNRELRNPSGPNEPKQLVEIFSGGRSSHTSRSAFHSTKGAEREDLIRSLKQGPLNVNSLSYSYRQDGSRGSRDDWHVGQNTFQKIPTF